MVWRADLFASASTLALDGSELLTSSLSHGRSTTRDKTGRTIRALKLALFDAPVSFYFVSWNHEYGHIARGNEAGIGVFLRLVGTPWSYPRFDLNTDLNYPRFQGPGPEFDYGAEAGGLEAGWVLKDRVEAAAIRSGRLSASAATTAAWATLDTPLYAAVNLTPDVLQSFPSGDLARYASRLVNERLRAHRPLSDDPIGTLRRRAMLNYLDLGLWSELVGVFRAHVWNGESSVPVLWLRIGRLRLLPSMRYAFTPVGPEASVRSYFGVGDHSGAFYVKRTEATLEPEMSGMGIAYTGRAFDGFRPRAAVDTWAGRIDGRGARVQIGGEIARGPFGTSRLGPITIDAGWKSAGYLLGLPLASGSYVSISAPIRVK